MNLAKKALAVFVLFIAGFAATATGEEAASLSEMFTKGTVSGSLKSYYFAQTFDGPGKNDSEIWTYGGNLKYVTGHVYNVSLGANFQGSFVGSKDDKDNKTAGSMDAHGAVLSEAYLQYKLSETQLKGGRQFVKLPLLAGSGSRTIHESFEAYFISNENLPDTQITAGWARKYQTRTDRSNYGDNGFVDFENNGTGTPGGFYDIGADGMYLVYLKNTSVENLEIQAQYADVVDAVAGFYADAKYQFPVTLKPYLAAQYYYTNYDAAASEDNYLYGVKLGMNISGVDLFAGYTAAGGSVGDARVFRGVGQGAYYQYTSTTKTAGAGAFEADTDAYQLGAAHTLKGLDIMLRYTDFDHPSANADLQEYNLNLLYKFSGYFKGFTVSADFSVLAYENNTNDATDLRTRLIYTF
ncbi:MAG: OprD family outer membrane porin [Proteobacteria bacterium]|nr:OprD family outer membrane porin [Pseudomonadota bacterium]